MKDAFEPVLRKGLDKVGVALTDRQIEQMCIHAQQLVTWNRKINLTAIKDPAQIAEKHFLDCIAAFKYLPGGSCLLDIGSGGGFPGCVFGILNPDAKIVLVDASRKKVNFLKHLIRMAGLSNVDAIHARVEDMHQDPDWAGQFDVVVSRAFAELSKFENLAGPFLSDHGAVFAMKGPKASGEISEKLKNRYAVKMDAYVLPFEKSHRNIVVMHPL